MRLEKEFKIVKVSSQNVSNAPFEIVLENDEVDFKKKNQIVLVMDKKTCETYSIPMSLGIVGRKIICVAESKIKDFEFVDELRIKSLIKKEKYTPFGSYPIKESGKIKRILELVSFDEGDGMHLHIMPCPFYRIFLSLTEEEHEECKNLPKGVLFKVNFKLKTT